MMLEVADLRAAYGRIPILRGITFSVAEGEFVGILGHNGMGKTSLLRALMGFLPATGGTVRLDGADITARPPHQRSRAGFGYVPQGREIFPNLSVLDNLRMGCAKVKGQDGPVIDAVVEDFPRLKRLLGRLGGNLSGGEQQLLAIARSLCGGPRLLLLDEPTAGMGEQETRDIAQLIRRLHREGSYAIILIEHDMRVVFHLAERITVLDRGALLADGTPEEIAANEAVQAAYLGKAA